MKRRVWVCIGLIICLVLLAGRAMAQSAAPASAAPANIPTPAKSATDATSYRPQIQQFIQGQLDALAGPDAATQSIARSKIISEAPSGSSTSYLDIYSQVLDSAARTVLNRNPPLRVRLNIAVVIYRVGMITRTKALEGSIIALINDPAEPVVLRGMQAAKPVIAAIVSVPNGAASSKLIAAILPAIKAQAKSGLVAAEAYQSLKPDPATPAAQRAIAEPQVLGTILDILDFRVSLYTTAIPDNPAAETDVPTFLYHSYQNATAPLQHRIVQAVVNFIAVAGQQATTAPKADLDEIIQTLIYSAQVLSANIPTVSAAVAPVVQMPKGTSGPGVAQKTKPIFGLLQPFLPFLQAPPAVTIATTAPSTNP